LVEQVMTRPPCNDARGVFSIGDHCSAHRGSKAAQRLRDQDPRLTLVHAPVHRQLVESGRNLLLCRAMQGSIPERLSEPGSAGKRLLDFQYYRESAAQPFEWKFTRQDLAKLLAKLENQPPT
jgi:hypothetical protein